MNSSEVPLNLPRASLITKNSSYHVSLKKSILVFVVSISPFSLYTTGFRFSFSSGIFFGNTVSSLEVVISKWLIFVELKSSTPITWMKWESLKNQKYRKNVHLYIMIDCKRNICWFKMRENQWHINKDYYDTNQNNLFVQMHHWIDRQLKRSMKCDLFCRFPLFVVLIVSHCYVVYSVHTQTNNHHLFLLLQIQLEVLMHLV